MLSNKFVISISLLWAVLFMTACGGGGEGSTDDSTNSGGSTPEPTPTPMLEPLAITMESSASNEPLATFHSNNLDLIGQKTGDGEIKFISIIILDELNVFDPHPVATLYNHTYSDTVRVQLEPRDDLRRGNYEGALLISYCGDTQCKELLSESPYLVSYTLDYVPSDWSIAPDEHPDLLEYSTGTFFEDLNLVFSTEEGAVADVVTMQVDWPNPYSGYTLPQEMIDELQVFDISDSSFSFRLLNSTQGVYEFEYPISLDLESGAKDTLSFNLGHMVVPVGFDPTNATVIEDTVDFDIQTIFGAEVDSQEITVFKPISTSGFFNWVSLEPVSGGCGLGVRFDGLGFGSVDSGFTTVEVKVDTLFMDARSYECIFDVVYLSEVVDTLTVNLNYMP